MGKPCRVELLGRLSLTVNGQTVTRFRTYKTGALLAYLAYHLGRPAPREELVEMLWPESADEQARNSLSQSVSSLRHLVEPPETQPGSVLEANRHTIRLVPEAFSVDADEFRDLAHAAKSAKLRGDVAIAMQRARDATALFAGEFLPGVYEDWTIGPREHLREEALDLFDQLIQATEDPRQALSLALQAVAVDPTREASHAVAIQAHAVLGQPEAAVKQYRELERALATQLGLKPTEQTRNLVKDALRTTKHTEPPRLLATAGAEVVGTPSWLLTTSRTTPPGGHEVEKGVYRYSNPTMAFAAAQSLVKADARCQSVVLTRGDHRPFEAILAARGQILCDEPTAALIDVRLADLGVFQIGTTSYRLFSDPTRQDFPSLPRPRTDSLPVSLSRFFGRGDELSRLEDLLTNPSVRLVTVTGPGGMGKTRLTLEAARRVAGRFPRTVAFVQLAEVERANELWTEIATALGIAPAPRATPMSQVVSSLTGGESLLVLDNFEQLCDAGGPQAVLEVLTACPQTSLLVSSRKRLGLDGETEVALSPLASPEDDNSVEGVLSNPAVALFLDRARAAKPDFQVSEKNLPSVVSLCQRLEGIPLALELAASRAQVLSPAQILERFDQRLDLLASRTKVERHRSLRAALDWTYDLLSAELKSAFHSLSVFCGSWALEQAEQVVGSPVTLDLLAELSDFSLVSTFEAAGGTVRFRMLDTMREYARQAAPPDLLAEVGCRHVEAYKRLASQSERKLEGPEQVIVLGRLEDDRANLRRAVESALERGDPESALEICGSVWRFWHLRSHLDEGRSLLNASLATGKGSPLARARAMNGAGRLAYLQGDYDDAKALHEQALATLGDDPDVSALALNALGAVAYEKGEYESAERLFNESLEIRRKHSDEFGIGNALSWLGIVYTDQGRYEDARAVLEESLQVRTRIGDTSGIARSHNSLGIVARRLGQGKLAAEHYESALAIQRQLGDRRAIGGLLSNLGMIAQTEGDHERAKQLFDEALKTNCEAGDKWGIATVTANQAALALDLGDVESAAMLNAEALRTRYEIGNSWGMAYSLEGSARTLSALGFAAMTVAVLARARRLRLEIGAPLPGPEEESLDALRASAESSLTQEQARKAIEASDGWTLPEAVAATLAALDKRPPLA